MFFQLIRPSSLRPHVYYRNHHCVISFAIYYLAALLLCFFYSTAQELCPLNFLTFTWRQCLLSIEKLKFSYWKLIAPHTDNCFKQMATNERDNISIGGRMMERHPPPLHATTVSITINVRWRTTKLAGTHTSWGGGTMEEWRPRVYMWRARACVAKTLIT